MRLQAVRGMAGNLVAENIDGLYKAEVIHRQRWSSAGREGPPVQPGREGRLTLNVPDFP